MLLTQSRTRIYWAYVVIGIIALLIGGFRARAQQAAPDLDLPDRVDFNWDIRPILSDNCFHCHGQDEKSRMAGLRLDLADSAYAERGRPARRAIVPGNPEASELVKRVTHPNVALRMPARSSNKTLTERQIALLRKWIAQGAEYKPHWAYLPPTAAAAPAVTVPNLTNEIDTFIVDRLRREGLQLSPEADKETLINRVSLTLTGLPPTLRDVDAFLADESPNAYERVVDRLLASPAYGEHMAAYWMDLARYAESDGFLDDFHDRLFWPYRDWVIAAFNRNMPFNTFAEWQLAGDLLPAHTKEQKLATAFLRLGQRTTENGAIDEEWRAEYTIERANTIGSAFLGLTTGCARCHDHKYDPISQKDFYSLTGFFNSNDEPGFYPPADTGITPGPTLPWMSPGEEAKLATAEALAVARAAEYEAVRRAAVRRLTPRASAATPRLMQEAIEKAQVAYYPFEETQPVDRALVTSLNRPPRVRPVPAPLAPESIGRALFGPPSSAPPLPFGFPPDASVLTRGQGPGSNAALLESPIVKPGVKGNALFFGDTSRGVALGVGDYERTEPFGVDVWVYAAKVYADATNVTTVFNRRVADYGGGTGYQLVLDKNHLAFSLMHASAGDTLRIRTKDAVPAQQWVQVTVTYDGSSRARGAAIYINGRPAEVDVLSDNLTRSTIPASAGWAGGLFGEAPFTFGRNLRFSAITDGAIDELRIFKRALLPSEVRYLHAQVTGQPAAAPSPAEVLEQLVVGDAEVLAAQARLIEARTAWNNLYSQIPRIPVMGETPTPRPTYLLVRGLYSEHGPEVQSQGLDQIFPWDGSLPRNRIGLVRWLFDPRHPLTSRVFVNRMWQRHFGRGLVETSEDFGSQGSIPSHPELLDWLAVTFRESGWDMKALQKRMVMSATYRQRSSVSDELLKRDARNLLLARYSRVRMPAELVRDNVLAASGLLVPAVGGKSVYPYQAPGIWAGLNRYVYPLADKIPADDHHRRSLYSFLKRNAPHPASASFDLPNRTVSTVRRQTSSSPLQALVLLDDPQYVEAYRVLAERVLQQAPTRDERVRLVFRLATRRHPRAGEFAELVQYYDSQLRRFEADRVAATKLLEVGVTPRNEQLDPVQLAALTNVALVVMNTADAYTLR